MQQQQLKVKYVVSDFIASNLAWFFFNLYRYCALELEKSFGTLREYLSYHVVIEGQLLFPLAMMFIYYLSGYYNGTMFKSRAQELYRTAKSAVVIVLLLFFAALLNDQHLLTISNTRLMVMMFAIIFGTVYLPRHIITQRTSRKVHHREWYFNTLIIGGGKRAEKVAERLQQMPKSLGHHIVGFVKTPYDTSTTTHACAPNFELEQLGEIMESLQVEEILIVPEAWKQRHLFEVINTLFQYNKPIKIDPDERALLTSRIKLSNIYGAPFIDLASCPLSESDHNLKRVIDIVLSATALVLLSPLFLVLAIVVKRSSKGSIIYRQERVGLRQKPFTLYKFRTMVSNAEETTPQLSVENDARLTPHGAIIRKYRLDEIPQFWNVLKGDMSLVGPRPERAYFIKQIQEKAPYYTLLHQIRPGITSWGMVSYGYARNVDEMIQRLRYDILYLENMSLLVDLKIIIYTIQTVVTGKGI